MRIDRDRLRFFGSLFLIGIPAEFAGFSLSDRLIAAHCPAGTFKSGSLEPAMYLLGIVGAILVLTFFIATQLKRVRWFKSEDDDWNGNLVPSYAYVIAFAGSIGICTLGTLSHFCAADSGIVYDDVANSISKNFRWQDVAAIKTRCYYYSGKSAGWRANIFVVMEDGTSVDLMGREGDMPLTYSRLIAALAGHDFAFSADIAPGCVYPHMEMLIQRP